MITLDYKIVVELFVVPITLLVLVSFCGMNFSLWSTVYSKIRMYSVSENTLIQTITIGIGH